MPVVMLAHLKEIKRSKWKQDDIHLWLLSLFILRWPVSVGKQLRMALFMSSLAPSDKSIQFKSKSSWWIKPDNKSLGTDRIGYKKSRMVSVIILTASCCEMRSEPVHRRDLRFTGCQWNGASRSGASGRYECSSGRVLNLLLQDEIDS